MNDSSCHIGIVVYGAPVVVPVIHVRVGDTVNLHGSPDSRTLQANTTGPTRWCCTGLAGRSMARRRRMRRCTR
jgi:hypothetical protein